MEQDDFVWIFQKMRHEGLPTIGNVRRYRRILQNRLNENDPEDQQDDGETMPVKIKYLIIGTTIGLETPFSITEETEQNQGGTNALKIVKEFLRVRPMKSLGHCKSEILALQIWCLVLLVEENVHYLWIPNLHKERTTVY